MSGGNSRTRARSWKPASDTEGGTVQPCDWPGCDAEGPFRAPHSPQRLRQYRWFCLEHVRCYNATWNYYGGMDEDQVEADVRRDTVWRRPSWPIGSNGGGPRIRDDFGVYKGANAAAPPWPPTTAADKALACLDLQPPVTEALVKARYKELVKRHHPDANGGTKDSEEKFKAINQAYQTIMESLDP